LCSDIISLRKNNLKQMKSKRLIAFTLIELLVVIAIVGVLSAFVFISLNSAANAANDARRKADVATIKNALIQYTVQGGTLPEGDCNFGIETSSCDDLLGEILGSYLPIFPSDPKSGSFYTYSSAGNNEFTIESVLSDTYAYGYDSTAGFYYEAPADGACGSANGSSFYEIPTENLCLTGTNTEVSGSGPWTWTCLGAYGGETDSCSANKKIDVACGSANGQQTYNPPTENLCDDNSLPPVNGTGPWTWECLGINGGTGASCSAGIIVNGECGTANKNYSSSDTTYGDDTFCSAGNTNPSTPDFPGLGGSVTWDCEGLNSGTTDNCEATRDLQIVNIAAIPGVTAPVTGATPDTAITETSQYTGTIAWNGNPTTFAGGTVYTATITLTAKSGYTFTGVAADFFTVSGATSDSNSVSSGIVTAVFPATAPPVNGACGTANKTYSFTDTSYGSDTFCSAGIAVPTTPAFPSSGSTTNWSCNGQNGGSNTNCSASRQGLVGYSKRKPITINSGSALTDYQVKLTVAYDTDMQADFDDLRFTTSDQTTQLNYWLESKTDSSTATIWVKIPSLASGDNTIYMYYANASATTASNGDNTFVFFDDFENGNLSKWSQYNPSYPASISTEWSSRAGTYSAKIVKPAADTDCGITRTINESSVQVIVDAKITSIGSGAGLYIRIPGGSQLSSVTTVSNWTVTWTATAPKVLYLTSYQWVGASPMTGYYDCVRIKKYNNPEPTVSAWGSEQP
jgi:prepilin-type N-terminal cleavage/methylation domain-containing protein